MNAALQCGLLAVEPLVEFFDSERDSPSRPLAHATGLLLEEVNDHNTRSPIYPYGLKSAIDEKLPRFRGTDQNDCSEFLIQFLDTLHEEVKENRTGMSTPPSRSSSFSMVTRSVSSVGTLETGGLSGRSMSAINWRAKGEQWWYIHRKSENSVIRKLFEGVIRSVLVCDVCGGVSARFDTFSQFVLSIGITRNPTAESLIRELLSAETLDGIDCIYCKRKRTFQRRLDLWRCPPYLILTLNRFSMDHYGSSVRKNNCLVRYENSLDLESLRAPDAPLQDSNEYELFGVIEHEGTVNRGHYTAMVKNGLKWFNVNDGRMTEIDPSYVLDSKNAYMLFYRWKGKLALEDLD
jgi:ubiquitin C-terminal hydrolase